MNYQEQAENFLAKTKTTLTVEFLRNGKYWDNDKQVRDIYKFTLTRGLRTYSAEFGQSIINSQYYQDSIPGRTYSLDGGCRTGGYSIGDIAKYQWGGQKLEFKKGKAPEAYDILSCLTYYDPGTFEDFCSELGYDTDSKRAEKTYNNVKAEWLAVCSIWTDEEIEELLDIC